MKLAPYGIVEFRGLDEPALQVSHAHPCFPALLVVPIDAIDWVVGRQIAIGLAGMIVDRAEGTHAAIRDVRSMLFTDRVVLGRDLTRIVTELFQRRIQPVLENALDVIAIALDPRAPVLALHRDFVPRPGFVESDANRAGLLLFCEVGNGRRLRGFLVAFGMYAAADLDQIFFGDRTRCTG